MEGANGQSLRLRELLEQPEFGLELVTSDERLLDREIVGAHAVDAPNPTRWLDEDWVLLTSGLSLKTRALQRELIRDAAKRGIAGLGFTVNLYFKRVPEALVDEANQRGVPIFSVPLEVRFKEIIAFIGQSRMSRDMFTLRRAFSIQRYLMESLQTAEPEGVLADRLSSVLQGGVLITDATGTVVSSRGSLPRASIWDEVAQRPAELQRFTIGRWSLISTPVRIDGTVRYWLVVAIQSKAVFEQLAKQAIESAAHLLALIGRSHRARLAEERALKGALLRELLDGRLSRASPGVVDRLRTYGFNDAAPVRAMVIRRTDGRLDVEGLTKLVESVLASQHRPALMLARESELDVLVEAGDGFGSDVDSLQGQLEETGFPALVALGRKIDDDTPVVDSVHDARLVIASNRMGRVPPGVVSVEDLDLVGMSLGLKGSENVAARAEQLLAPLEEHDHLVETLLTYFDVGLDVAKTGTRLHLHPNSIRYRLSQIEKHLGIRLDRPAGVANLYLALQLRAMASESADSESGSGPPGG